MYEKDLKYIALIYFGMSIDEMFRIFSTFFFVGIEEFGICNMREKYYKYIRDISIIVV